MSKIDQQVMHHPNKAKRTRRSHTDWKELVTFRLIPASLLPSPTSVLSKFQSMEESISPGISG